MNLEITGIEDAGDMERERVVLRAKTDTDLGEYAIFMGKGASDDGSFLSGHVPSAYWFNKRSIKAGDFAVVYTKEGTASSKTENGHTSYFYYWGWKQPKWVKGAALALVNTINWSVKRIK